MHKLMKQLAALGLLLSLAACNTGNNSLINQNFSITLTPSSANIALTVPAGGQLQFTATVTGISNTTVLWYVNGQPGGNSIVGTISPQGLYTAPNLPPVNGSVTIVATSQQDPAVAAATIVHVSYANASLNGRYVFLLSGTQAGKPWAAAGEFTAHGDGTLDGGLEDINDAGSASTALAFTGSYNLTASGQGSASFTSSQGTINLQLAMTAGGGAALMRSDAGSTVTGNLYPQTPSALSLTALDGSYAFGFSSNNPAGQSVAALGVFNAAAGSSSLTGETDVNFGGTLSAALSLSGQYALGNNGRGTATLSDSSGSRHYSFYAVSPTQLVFVQTDSGGVLAGNAVLQNALTSASMPNPTLSGSFVFSVGGSTSAGGYGAIGQFGTLPASDSNGVPLSNGTLSGGSADINSAGTVSVALTISTSSTFNVAANGRGTLAISDGNGTQNYIFYLFSSGGGFIMAADPGILASGPLTSQAAAAYGVGTLVTSYGLQIASTPGVGAPQATLGVAAADGVGDFRGSVYQMTNGSFSTILSLSGLYNLAITGRGVATLTTNGGATASYVYYAASPGLLLFLGTDATPSVGTFTRQF